VLKRSLKSVEDTVEATKLSVSCSSLLPTESFWRHRTSQQVIFDDRHLLLASQRHESNSCALMALRTAGGRPCGWGIMERGRNLWQKLCDLLCCHVATRPSSLARPTKKDKVRSTLMLPGDLPLPVAARTDANLTTRKLLVRKHPGAVRVPNRNGELPPPLHLAARHNSWCHNRVRHLITKWPGVDARDDPLHFALGGNPFFVRLSSASSKRPRRRWSGRRTGTDGGESPCTTRSRNLSGRIAPSVSSSRSGRVRRGGATLAGTSRCTCWCRTRGRAFWHGNDSSGRLSIRARDPRGLYPVHVAAAASSDVPIDVVYRLARACPEALLNLDRNVLAYEKARPVRPPSPQGSPAVVVDYDLWRRRSGASKRACPVTISTFPFDHGG
jgi:hypothetical protein